MSAAKSEEYQRARLDWLLALIDLHEGHTVTALPLTAKPHECPEKTRGTAFRPFPFVEPEGSRAFKPEGRQMLIFRVCAP